MADGTTEWLLGEQPWLSTAGYAASCSIEHKADHRAQQQAAVLHLQQRLSLLHHRGSLLIRPSMRSVMCSHLLQPWLMEHSTLGLAEFLLLVQLVSAAPPEELHWPDSAAQLAPLLLASVLGLLGHQATPARGGRPKPGRLNTVSLRGARSRAIRAEVLSSWKQRNHCYHQRNWLWVRRSLQSASFHWAIPIGRLKQDIDNPIRRGKP
jgi:hypothetical protein